MALISGRYSTNGSKPCYAMQHGTATGIARRQEGNTKSDPILTQRRTEAPARGPLWAAAGIVFAAPRRTRPPRRGARGRPRTRELSPQLTAFFTSLPIFASSVAVNFFSAKDVGHMAPSSRFAVSLKPNVAYLDLNLSALWK